MVTDWTRTSGEFDAVADFDRATKEPSNPEHLLSAYNSGDGTHLSDARNQAMADAIDLHQLIASTPDRGCTPRAGGQSPRPGRATD